MNGRETTSAGDGPRLPPFDLDEALRRCVGSRELFGEIVGAFFDEADPSLERLRTALAHGDAAEVAATAHRLKGTVVYLGAARTEELTKRVEAAGRAGDLAAAAAAVDDLDHELAALKTALAPHRR